MGRLQPQARELEEAALGALMLEKDAYNIISGILQPESFYDKAHEMIFSAIVDLALNQRPVDMLTVTEQLRKRGELEKVGGPFYISQLTSKVASSSHIEYHARIIAQKHLARQLISLTDQIQSRAFDETEDVDEILEALEVQFTELTVKKTCCESVEMGKAVHDALEKAAKVQDERNKGNTVSIPSGIGELDRYFYGGWRAPDLVVLGGRPSMGKTQLAIHFAKSAAEAGKGVLFVSIEMTATQLVNRLLLEDGRISAYNLATGQMSNEEWEAVDRRAAEIWNYKIHIASGNEVKFLDNICSEARRLKRKGKLGMVIIDHLGLIILKKRIENRYLEIGYITRTLKGLAKELDVPVMLLCQLKRPENPIKVYVPQLHDLRESGDIEQDADAVLFIHRPSYYDKDDREWQGKGKIVIAKFREGERKRNVIFYHDENFKKVWGEDEAPCKMPEGNLRPVAPSDEFFDETPF